MSRPNQFLSPEGDLEDYFVDEYWLIDQYVGDALWTWGYGNNGRLGNGATTVDRSTPITTFAGGTNWKQVSTLDGSMLAIKTDGTLWGWGFNGQGQLGDNTTISRSTPVTTFAGGTNWRQVSLGRDFATAIKTDGTLWTWGWGAYGRLGNGLTTGNRSTPVTTFAGGTNWKQVASGVTHTVAIKTDGTLWTWGENNGFGFILSGQLGNNSTVNVSTPVTTFAGGTNWKQGSCGYRYTAAIKTDGTLWTWGDGGQGQLGRFASGIDRVSPVTTFAGGTNWADTATTEPENLYTLSAGNSFTAAIKTDGTLWTWGDISDGRLGNAVATGTISTPITTFAGGTNWKQVSSGNNHAAAIKTDGTLWAWGLGTNGRLGNAVATGNISTPVTTFAGGTNWRQVACGRDFTAAIKTDGTLWTWGFGGSGRLGNGATATINISTPITTFAGGTNWKQVSIGLDHAAAIKTDGTLWTWGAGSNSRLGNAELTNRCTPVTTFAGGTNWRQVACGGYHTAAIKTDGTLWTWGAGTNGRLGNAVATGNISTPVTTFAGGTNWRQVACGRDFTAAIKTDGTLWTWGFGGSGRLGNGATGGSISTPVTTFAGGTNWKQVSSGVTHTIALRGDGVNIELYVFGGNANGQLGVPISSIDFVPNQTFSGGINWKQVTAGANSHTAAIKTDGTLWTWGDTSGGRLGNGVTVATSISTPITTFAGGTNWKQVSCGNIHTSAIKTDGTLWTWGFGTNGRLGNAVITGTISTPVTTFAGGTNWKQVSSGFNHTAAVEAGINAEYPLS